MAVTHVHVDNMANMAGYTPKETAELMSRIGAQRGRARPDKIFFSAFMAGCLVSFTAASAVIGTASPWFQENAPGLIRMISGLIFPSGIVMILISGSELFTGSNMITGIAWMHRRLPLKKLLLHWFLCFCGNMAGALFVMAIIVGYGGVLDNEVFKKQAIANAQAKQLIPGWHQIFLRAIGCNWLVCLSCYLGLQAKDVTSKVAGMWWPIFAFVTMGLDHVVANMFFIPIGIFLGAPGISIGLYIWKGLIPTTLGNMLGGFFFCGFFYFYMHLLGEEPIAVDGVYYQQPERSLEEGNLFSVRSGTIVEDGGGNSSNYSGEFKRTAQAPTTVATNKVQ
ncbi:Formate/nitrite transporter-domain-containing protein [Apiosordaria backusii]|uniref:Formate/nitrite transporter-domain-containing protein n=1 Tax=Apiosordaria backusii TaxID=314023 RepID=A0AA40EZU4_9PEZI|nr:Formate/nitrite transporter-domain-containing protein [Apiosordaria backusii]